jgi:hypothetical protein
MQPVPPVPSVDFSLDPKAIYSYLVGHNWYACAAVAVMIAFQIIRKKEVAWYQKTPNGYRFLWPVGLSMLGAFVHGFVLGEPLKQALFDMVNAVWQIAGPAMGLAAALKESPLPWDGGAGGLPKIDLMNPAPGMPGRPTLVPPAPPTPPDDRPTPIDPSTAPKTPPPAA